MMKVFVNQKQVEISTQANVTTLLQKVSLPTLTGIAVAVNNQVVKKDDWESYYLSEDDNVLVIKAAQGG